MDPILLIIKYIFKKSNIINNDDSIEVFFENGLSFPQFISIIFGVDEIPKINKNPKTLFHKKMNNDVALQFLYQKNSAIAKFNPGYGNDQERANLLLLILTKQCFKINVNEIISKCNLIVHPLNIIFEKKSDIISPKCLLSLLSVFSDGKININQNLNTIQDFDDIMTENFQKVNAPFVINKSCLDIQNQNLFLIQIEILFDFFSDKLNKIENNQQIPKTPAQQQTVKTSNQQQASKASGQQQTSKTPDQKQTSKTSDQQQTSKTSDQQQTLKASDQQQTSKTSDQQQTVKTSDQQQTVKTSDQQQTVKTSDQQQTLKASDQQQTSEISDQQQIQKASDKQQAPDQNNSKKELDDDDDDEEEDDDLPEELNDQNDFIPVDDNSWKKIDQKIKKKKKEKKRFFGSDSESNSSSYEDDDINNEEHQEDALLKTLNVIGKGKFHFNNFHDAVINDSIPRFVMFYLKLKSIPKVHLTQPKSPQKYQTISKKQHNNIKAVIEFLITKEIKFKILKFNFGNRATEESSAVLFYSNFLNFFFIKTLKLDMYKRCGAILSTKRNFHDYEDKSDLVSERVLSSLLHFYTEKNLHFKVYDMPSEIKYIEPLFEKAKIPLVINQKIFDIGSGNQMADSVYYQYQLIFDAIDSGPKSLFVLERLLTVIYKLNKLEVPKYKDIAGSILAKRVSLEFQNTRFDQYLKRTDSKSLSESMSSFESIPVFEDVKKPVVINTYQNRQQDSIKSKLNEGSNDNESQNEFTINKVEFEKFWNSIETNLCYDKGILYNKLIYQANNTQFQKNWTNEMNNIQKNIDKSAKSSTKEKEENKPSVSFKTSQKSFNSKLYKIFCYDEDKKCWVFQSDIFQQFASDKKIDVENSHSPVVLFLNSYEEDSIALTSNLINGVYPQLDSEQDIFVYSFCDKALSMLNFQVDFQDTRKSSIKPIFLLLHVPKGKENLPNIQQIIFEIYLYLFFISDSQIVLLNKNHYSDQIELTKCFKNIYDSYQKKYGSKSDRNIYSDSSDESTEKDEEDDELNFELEEEIWENDIATVSNANNIKNENEESQPNITLKDGRIIFLVNEPNLHYNNISYKIIKKVLNENELFKSISNKKEGKNLNKLRCINVKEPDSYEPFLRGLNTILYYGDSCFSEVKNNFNLVSLSQLKPAYVYIRCNESNWKEYLKDIIIKRKKEIESKSTDKKNSLISVTKLANEVSQIHPLFDIEFINECNLVLSNLMSIGSKANKNLYSTELNKSAESHLTVLRDRINEKYFWTEEQIDLVKKSHEEFLKNEFYDIIILTSSEKNYNSIYEENYDILNEQIKGDKIKIDEIFKPYIEKINIKKNPKEQDIKEKILKGANYCMKETENLREIKVTVQIKKDLESEIKQDF